MRGCSFVIIWLFCLGALGAEFGGALPLWQLESSPVLVFPGTIVNFLPAETPKAMVIADINGDGVGELLTGADYIHVFSLRDRQIFQEYLFPLVGVKKFVGPGGEKLGVLDMKAGDLDLDGYMDLVVTTRDGKLWVFINHREWGFQRMYGSPYSVSGAVRLFDHDGDGDLDVILWDRPKLKLLRNDGRGQLSQAEEIATFEVGLWSWAEGIYAGKPGIFFLFEGALRFLAQGEFVLRNVLDVDEGWTLAVGDFFGSGKKDVAIGGRREVRVYPGGAEGLGEPQVYKVNHYVAGLFAGDLNGDGLCDLVAVASSPGGFSVLYSWAQKGFWGPYFHAIDEPGMGGFPAELVSAAVGDVTGDGRDDLAFATNLGFIGVLHTQPRGRSLQALPGSFLLGSVDYNNDGFPDLLASTQNGGVAVLINSGWGTFISQELVGPSEAGREPYIARLADVTGDGQDELVVFEFANDMNSRARISVWDLATRRLLWSRSLGMNIRPILLLSDQTGDGVKDIVSAVGDKVIVLKHGEMPERKEISWGGPVGPLVVLRDGTVAGLRVGVEVALVLLRDGQVIETGLTLPFAPFDLIAADLDRDGHEDLISIGWTAWENALTVGLAVLWGGKEGGFKAEIYPLPSWPVFALPYPYWGLTAADLDGDGKLELAAMRLPDKEGNPGGIVVIPWTESGPGELCFLPGCEGTNLLSLDLDRDGRAELISVRTGTPPWLCLVAWEVRK
jgi:hypothetical protein